LVIRGSAIHLGYRYRSREAGDATKAYTAELSKTRPWYPADDIGRWDPIAEVRLSIGNTLLATRDSASPGYGTPKPRSWRPNERETGELHKTPVQRYLGFFGQLRPWRFSPTGLAPSTWGKRYEPSVLGSVLFFEPGVDMGTPKPEP
jgi:hypothetical protein